MAKAGRISYGIFPCHCCCRGTETEHTDYNCLMGQMSCTQCGCRRGLEAPVITIRLYHAGRTTVGSVAEFAEAAIALGAPSETTLVTENSGTSMYVDISTDSITTRREIERIREQMGTPGS